MGSCCSTAVDISCVQFRRRVVRSDFSGEAPSLGFCEIASFLSIIQILKILWLGHIQPINGYIVTSDLQAGKQEKQEL